MKKRYVYTQKAWIVILSGIAMLLAVISVILNILRLCEVGSLVSYNHPLDIIATVVMLAVASVLLMFVAGSGYSFAKKYFVVNLGFFVKMINYQDIMLVRGDINNTVLFVYFKPGKNAMIDDVETGFRANYIQIYVDPKYFSDILGGLKKENSAIIYELFGDNKEKKDEGGTSK